MNERMAHFLTAPYMSIYYNADSAEILPRTEGETAALSLGVHRYRRNKSRTVSIHRTDLFSTTRQGPRARGEKGGRPPSTAQTTKHRFHRRESDNTGGNRRFRLLPIASRDSLSCFSFLSIPPLPLSPPSSLFPTRPSISKPAPLLSLPVESQPPESRSAGGHCRTLHGRLES
ncbi:Uncharacterized protein DBV15_04924 [Temnothorax longispinosus]|uniref:Uncharacterized protein n=1 Tax=Temnothorax longispinosus TaxID=300112 RepID=A0A4S2KUF3_9HYME|nr:Uncharacterized protein DBV15_04924 [Temnothorax longispinosus]